jgi:hypothetical protein
MARPERLELPTYWFEASRSIHLSYGRATLIIPALQLYPRCAGALRKCYAVRETQSGESTAKFPITVKEFVTPPEPAMLFFAQADTPVGPGRKPPEALSGLHPDRSQGPL